MDNTNKSQEVTNMTDVEHQESHKTGKNRVNTRKKSSVNNVRIMTMTAMLAAVAFVLMFFDFNVPFMPGFIKMDLSEFPALIGAFAMGPISGAAICLIKNLIHLTMTTTGGVGELSNFILGASFAVTAGCIYKSKKTKTRAIIASIAGALVMALVSIPSNYFLVYPVYTKFMPLDAIIGAYQAINPKVNGLLACLVTFNAPFTFVKGMACVMITLLIYKPLSPVIKGVNA